MTTPTRRNTRKPRPATLSAYSTALGAGRNALASGMRFVERNPIGVVCGAVALGALATWAIRRRAKTLGL